MSASFERNKKLLMNILPDNYEYHIVGVSIRDATANIKSEVKLEAQFRVNVSDEEEFEKFYPTLIKHLEHSITRKIKLIDLVRRQCCLE